MAQSHPGQIGAVKRFTDDLQEIRYGIVGVRSRTVMSQLPENVNSVHRRTNRKWVAGVLVLYGVLIVMTVRVATGNQLLQTQGKPTPAVASLSTSELQIGQAYGANGKSH
jgi:hypothetical protein